jgi:hypothetical protein
MEYRASVRELIIQKDASVIRKANCAVYTVIGMKTSVGTYQV